MAQQQRGTPFWFRSGEAALTGSVRLPEQPKAIVILAHATSGSRHLSANRRLADEFAAAGFATAIVDLLSPDEEQFDSRTEHFRTDPALLATRLLDATEVLRATPEMNKLPVILMADGWAASAAFVAAASTSPELVRGVISRDGRPDLAGPALKRILRPSLLIVDCDDLMLAPKNREAAALIENSSIALITRPEEPSRIAPLIIHWIDEILGITPPPRLHVIDTRESDAKGAVEEEIQRIRVIEGTETLGYHGSGREEFSGENTPEQHHTSVEDLADNAPDQLTEEIEDSLESDLVH